MHHIDTCCINFDVYLYSVIGLQIFNSKQFEIEHFQTIKTLFRHFLVVKRNVNVNNNGRKCVYVRVCVSALFLYGPSNNPHTMYTFTWKDDNNKKKSMFMAISTLLTRVFIFEWPINWARKKNVIKLPLKRYSVSNWMQVVHFLWLSLN